MDLQLNKIAKNINYSSQRCNTSWTKSDSAKPIKRTEPIKDKINKASRNEKIDQSGQSSHRMVLNLNQSALDLKVSVMKQHENFREKENLSYIESTSRGKSYKSSRLSSNSKIKQQILHYNGQPSNKKINDQIK